MFSAAKLLELVLMAGFTRFTPDEIIRIRIRDRIDHRGIVIDRIAAGLRDSA